MSRSHTERWNTAFSALKNYRKKHPGEWPLWKHVTPDGVLLGEWCRNQRQFRKRGALSRERIARLDGIGFPWKGAALARAWSRAFDALKRFREKHGHCRAPNALVDNGINLQNWCHEQREIYKKGKLARDRVRKLEGIEFEWEPYDDRWEKGLLALKHFRYTHPERWPRAIEIQSDGFKLGSWCQKQRTLNKQGILPKERKRRLDAIGFEWEPEEALWKRAFSLLRLYRRDNPHRWPPASFVTSGGFRLGAWCQNKRTSIRRGVLSKDHLRQVREIGFK